MSLFPTCDLKLAFDATGFVCDLEITGGDLALDLTPSTPMLVSLGSDRRAATDDELPNGNSALTVPTMWNPRRGWVGDCLSALGRRIGSRFWLMGRDHESEATRTRAESYAAEALGWAKRDWGITPEISVAWVRTGILRIRAAIDGRSVTVTKRVT